MDLCYCTFDLSWQYPDLAAISNISTSTQGHVPIFLCHVYELSICDDATKESTAWVEVEILQLNLAVAWESVDCCTYPCAPVVMLVAFKQRV